MAVRDAVLSQSPEFKEQRIRALSNATVIYDLLTICLVRWGQVSLLHEVKLFNYLDTFDFESADICKDLNIYQMNYKSEKISSVV